MWAIRSEYTVYPQHLHALPVGWSGYPCRTYRREDAITRHRLYLLVRKDIIALQQMSAIVKNYHDSMLKIIRISHFLPI